jgi:hypothetical protein
MLLGAKGIVSKSLVRLTSTVKTTSSTGTAGTLTTLASDVWDRVAAATAAAIALAVSWPKTKRMNYVRLIYT